MSAERVMQDPGAYKSRILAYLWERRRTTLRPPYSVDRNVDAMGIAAGTAMPAHDVMHVLYSLQKADAIRFRERKRATRRSDSGMPKRLARMPGGASNLDSFQITAIGEHLISAADTVQDVKDVTADLAAEARREAKRLADRERAAAAWRRDHPDAPPYVPTGVQGGVKHQARRRTPILAAPGEDAGGAWEAEAKPPAEPSFIEHITGRPRIAPEASPRTAVAPRDALPVLDDVLTAVLARHAAREKVRAAADALEAAGLTDAALEILDRIPWSDLEDAISRHLIADGYGRTDLAAAADLYLGPKPATPDTRS